MTEALSTIEELERQAAEAEAVVTEIALTDEERRRAAAVARLEKAREAKRVIEKQRRDLNRAEREQSARRAAGTRYLVRGVDLVECFPGGVVPEEIQATQFPGNGVVIVRSPTREQLDATQAEIEHKRKPMATILTELALLCVIDPDPKAPGEGMRLSGFCEAYGAAATNLGDECYKLGGGKATADKRGSS